MDMPSEFAGSVNLNLLLQSLRLDDHDAALREAERIIRGGMVDWEELYDIADAHSVKPQLAQMINGITPDLMPDSFREKINSAYQKNLYSQLGFAAGFLKIKNLLEQEGIIAVPFKGFWLAHEMYGNVGDRESTDIDLFINFRDFERINILLQGIGYQPEKNMINYPIDKLEGKSCEYTLNMFEDKILVSIIDLHWKMSPPDYLMDISLSELNSQIIPSVFQDQSLSVFSPSANLLLSVMHHGGKDPLTRLKHVYDIARIIEKDCITDWSWIIREAKRFHVEDLLMTTIKVASVITGVKIPQQINSGIESKKINRLANNRIRAMAEPPARWRKTRVIINDWIFRLRSRDSLRVKISLVSHFIRKVLAPRLIPKSLHFMFTKKKISDDVQG